MSLASGASVPDRAATAFLVLVTGWLFAAALTSPFELFDTWDAISNARMMLGWEDSRFSTVRGTFWSIAFLPVEALRRAIAWPSYDARPFRLFVAALHSGALWLTWRLIRRQVDVLTGAHVLGFVLAVACPVYALYAPYRSTDVLPGVWLLVMVLCAWRYGQAPMTRDLVVLGVIGLFGALMKPAGGGLLWLSALATFALTARADVEGGRLRRGLALLAAAALGALVYWTLRGLLISAMGDDRPWWQLPWIHMKNQAEDAYVRRGHHFHYISWLRNIWGYGGAALLLAILGAGRGWRERHGVGRAIAVGWAAFLLLSFTNAIAEIRYLAPAIPLTAYLAARGLDVVRGSPLRVAVALVAVVDLGIAGWTATSAFSTATSTEGGAQPLVARLRQVNGPIVVAQGPSFVLDRTPPFIGDPYHGVTSARATHVALWLDRPFNSLQLSTERVAAALRDPDGRIVLANSLLIHVPLYLSAEQIAAYRLDVGRPRSAPAADHVVVLPDGRLDIKGVPYGWMYPLIDGPDGRVVPLAPGPDGLFIPRGPLPDSLEGATLRGAEVAFSCDAKGRCEP